LGADEKEGLTAENGALGHHFIHGNPVINAPSYHIAASPFRWSSWIEEIDNAEVIRRYKSFVYTAEISS
jgi:hypothetical protein